MKKVNIEKMEIRLVGLKELADSSKRNYDKTRNLEDLEVYQKYEHEYWTLYENIRYHRLMDDVLYLKVEEIIDIFIKEFECEPTYKSKNKVLNQMATLRAMRDRMERTWN